MTAAAQTISLQLDGNAFKVVGWPAAALRRQQPAGSPSSSSTRPRAMCRRSLGSYAVENGTLVFRPKYPLAAGRALPRGLSRGAGTPIEKTFDGPARSVTPSARVERVYPSADVLPSNQLRLYIYFSAPMSRGEAEQRIHVLDANGKPLRGVFLPGQELWDPNNTRLTMTFDPGRIKRDLTSNKAMGPPIAEGKRYTLVIDREWRDANGVADGRAIQESVSWRAGQCVSRPIRRRGDSRRRRRLTGSARGRLRPADELHAAAADAEGRWRARRCRGHD